jgi:hypothetical protein
MRSSPLLVVSLALVALAVGATAVVLALIELGHVL